MNLDIGVFILLDIVIASQITSNSFYRATVVYANSKKISNPLCEENPPLPHGLVGGISYKGSAIRKALSCQDAIIKVRVFFRKKKYDYGSYTASNILSFIVV